MTVVVAGGAGFLGSWMCERLLREGRRVVCVDNFDTGTSANVDHLLGHPEFELINHDVRDTGWVQRPHAVTHVMNFACPASPVAYGRDPLYTLETCFMGTRNLALLALQHNAVFMQASTSEVYGDPDEHPQSESYWGRVNPIGPRACYDEGKRVAETFLYDAVRRFRLDLKLARLFNTYGPRMAPDDGRAVANFVVQALKGEPVTVYGDGQQTRSFCYVDDMIEALYRLTFVSSPEFRGPVNLGNPVETPICDLARLVMELVGRGTLIYVARPTDDPELRRPDIELAKRTLRWSPGTGIVEGVEATIEYFRHRLGIAS